MSSGASEYPIVQFISDLMDEYGFSPAEFVQALGYRIGANRDRGLRRLNLWLETGEGYDRILLQIAAVYPEHAEALQKALADTQNLKKLEAEAAFLDRCKAEQERFTPYIHADGETKVPNGICLFGISGGHERWTMIRIPESIIDLPLVNQLAALPKLMKAYRRRYGGQVPFFGDLTGFRFVRCLDYYQFDRDAAFVEHVERPFRTGYVEVSLR